MVHALNEARRVLVPNGLLIDLRPAPVHRRVGISRGKGWNLVGVMRERFADDYAADRAVRQVLRQGWLKPVRRMRFDCPRIMDTLEEFRAWLDEFVQPGDIPSHDWLVKRLAKALEGKSSRCKIVVRGPLVMQVLAKAID